MLCSTLHLELPLALEGKGEGGGGFGDLVAVAPIHQWNLTLCPDGTKSGLQLMGTSPSSKGHLAGISHTLPHTHISNPRYALANWFSAGPSQPFVQRDMVVLFALFAIYMFLYYRTTVCESHIFQLRCNNVIDFIHLYKFLLIIY